MHKKVFLLFYRLFNFVFIIYLGSLVQMAMYTPLGSAGEQINEVGALNATKLLEAKTTKELLAVS